MKRKFSFDIPRLKIGPSKADTRALRDHLAIQLDSPPLTPKSVRPPLSPVVEADLRAACAYVLQNFKPSHVVYEEQYGPNQQKQQLDYAAIKESVHREVEEPAARPLSKVSSQIQEPAPAEVEEPENEAISPDRYRYKPDVATEDLFKSEKGEEKDAQGSAVRRAEQLMAPVPPKGLLQATRDRSGSHLRSVSSPVQLASLAAPKVDLVERPRTATRADSMETTGSTPQTDSTDYPWSDEKTSTAMTSAAITPARGSKRTSSQALQPGSEAGSMPRVEPVDADWMRQELDKHKRVQVQRLEQEKASAEAESAFAGSDTTPKQVTQAPTPTNVKVPARKPVPRSRAPSTQAHTQANKQAGTTVGADSRQNSTASEDVVRSSSTQATEVPRSTSTQDVHPPRSESRQGSHPPRSESRQPSHLPRSESRQDAYPPRSESRQGSYPPRSESRQARAPERALSRARSITRQVKDYVRPGSAQRTVRPGEMSRPHSRTASRTRQVKEYFRSATAASSRKPSFDAVRPERRSRSTDSFRTAKSDAAASTASSKKKWRGLKPFHRARQSQDAADSSRPGTSGSDTRGRSASRDAKQSPQPQKSKPAVNLNRDLPPLPSLDSWKAEEAEKPKRVAALGSPVKEKGDGLRTPKSHRSSRSRQDSRAVTVGAELGERDEIIAARMGSPTPPRSHKPSVDLRTGSAPPQPTAPPPSIPMSANISGPNDLDFDYAHLAPTTSIDPQSAIADMKRERRRSKSIQAAFPSELHDKVKASLGKPVNGNIRRNGTTGKTQLVNYSRVAGGPLNGGLSRKISRAGHVAATTNHTPVGHSRDNSDHDFTRNLSMDDNSRMHDARYRNMVEISSTKQAPPASVVRDKKWWQRMGKKPHSPSWMDQVVKSGSNSGVLLTDEVAGAPIVRY